MTAEEIRKGLRTMEDNFDDKIKTISPEVANLRMIAGFTGEIAAQLAELNETLKCVITTVGVTTDERHDAIVTTRREP